MNTINDILTQYEAQSPQTTQRELGKSDFMHLLITQLTNQDPLQPLKDEEFVAQLAQFSSLEQLQNMNDNLSDDSQWNYILSQTISNTMATSLIGREVTAEASSVYLGTDGKTDIGFTLDTPVPEVTIVISDADGNTVRTITKQGLSGGENVITWDGKNDRGEAVAPGVYQVAISGKDASGNSFDVDSLLKGKVDGVVYRDGSAMLMINGLEVMLGSVISVKEA
jgi:flagellar basal-body rod modification protein FlgD